LHQTFLVTHFVVNCKSFFFIFILTNALLNLITLIHFQTTFWGICRCKGCKTVLQGARNCC